MFNFDKDMPVWFYDQPTTITPLNVYKEFFEKPFLENTEQFYRIEASKHLADESLIEYLTKVTID